MRLRSRAQSGLAFTLALSVVVLVVVAGTSAGGCSGASRALDGGADGTPGSGAGGGDGGFGGGDDGGGGGGGGGGAAAGGPCPATPPTPATECPTTSADGRCSYPEISSPDCFRGFRCSCRASGDISTACAWVDTGEACL